MAKKGSQKRVEQAIEQKRVPSTAAIKSHPIHPMLVNFPLGLLYAVVAADVAFWWTGDPFWARGAFWLIAGGLAGGLAAALSGITDFVTIRYAREQVGGWSHFLSGITALSLATANLLWRWEDPAGAVLPWGLLLSFDTAVLLGFAGWLGGKLTFHHLIGSYIEEEEKQRLAEEAVKAASPPREKR
jgi:uncharacterized membrane protein